ncbi:MAG: ABC transporter permease [Candidatus Ranarchaeia archaeon]
MLKNSLSFSILKRDKHFILVTIIVLMMSMGLLNGVLINVDASIDGVLQNRFSTLGFDLEYEYDPIEEELGLLDLTQLLTYFEQQFPLVSDVVDSLAVKINTINGFDEKQYIFGIDNEFYEEFPNLINCTSRIENQTNHGIAMDFTYVNNYNLTLGDNFNISIEILQDDLIKYFTLNYTLESIFELSNHSEGNYWNVGNRPIVITNKTLLKQTLDQRVNGTEIKNYKGKIFVKLDHSAINGLNIFEIEDLIIFESQELSQEFLPYVSFSGNPISNTLRELEVWYESQQVIFFIMAIPLLICGWLIAKHIIDIKTTGRRYEIGILKSRGATKAQFRKIETIEGLITGLIGGVGAIPAGILISWLIRSAMGLLIFDIPSILTFQFRLPFWIILLSIGITTLLQTLNNSWNSSPTLDLSILDATKRVSDGNKAPFPYVLIFAIFTLGSFIAYRFVAPVYLWVSPDSFSILFGEGAYGLAVEYSILFLVILSVTIVMAFITPYLRVFFTRLFSKLLNPISKKLISCRSRLLKKNDIYFSFILSLIIGVSISGIISAGTVNNHLYNTTYYHTGSDVRIDFQQENLTLPLSTCSYLNEIENIDSSTFTLIFDCSINENSTIKGIGLDPTEFKQIAFTNYVYISPFENLLDFIFQTNCWNALNNTPKGVLLSRSFESISVDSNIISVGDEIPFKISTIVNNTSIDYVTNMTIIGFIDAVHHDFSDEFIIFNLDYISNILEPNAKVLSKIYFKTQTAYNSTLLKEELEQQFSTSVKQVFVAQEYLQEITYSEGYHLIMGFFSLNLILAILLGGIGLIMLLILRINAKSREIGILLAIGLNRKELNNYFYADTLTMILSGIIFGSIIGNILAIQWSKIALMFMGIPYELQDIVFPLLLVIPVIPVLVFISLLVGLNILITSFMAKKFLIRDIPKLLKVEIDN